MVVCTVHCVHTSFYLWYKERHNQIGCVRARVCECVCVTVCIPFRRIRRKCWRKKNEQPVPFVVLFSASFINVVSVFHFSSSSYSIECAFLGQNRAKLLLYFFSLGRFFCSLLVASPKFTKKKRKRTKKKKWNIKKKKYIFFFAWNQAQLQQPNVFLQMKVFF